MAYLDKEAYAGKKRYADRKMAENAEIETLTPEQHDALSWLCGVRHDMHTDGEAFFRAESSNHKTFWEYVDSTINEKLTDARLKKIIFGDTDVAYITDWTYKDDGYDYDEAMSETLQFANRVNNKIESYLREIDEEYDTKYRPTGETRIY